jgi:hypothetical protein
MADPDLRTAAQALLDATCPVRGICPLCSTGGFAHADGCEWKALRAALAAATEPPLRLNAGERMTVAALLERVDAWVESVEGTPAPWALVGDMADFLRRLAAHPRRDTTDG